MSFIKRLFYLLTALPGVALAQEDSTFFETFPDKVSARIYLSQKYTSFILKDNAYGYELKYWPNTTLNLGLGATYKWATINVAFGFPFMNPDVGRGKSKYLDLQFHRYGRKMLIDAYGQFYRGFYLAPEGLATNEEDKYYVRPDLFVNELGLSMQYIFNNKRFSYPAAFLQSEWQKRSAGTFLLGGEIFAGEIFADSTLIPARINAEVAEENMERITFVELGPSAGYAYTLVVKKHFFATASVSGSLDAGLNTLYTDEGEKREFGFRPNSMVRLAAGYNSRIWSFNAVYINNTVRLPGDGQDKHMRLRTGNVRFHLVYRFLPGRKVKNVLRIIDKIDEKIKK